MVKIPENAKPGPISDELLAQLIEVAEAHEACTPVSDAEATFFLFAAPSLLRELQARRRAQAGVDWMNRPTNLAEEALKKVNLTLLNGGAA